MRRNSKLCVNLDELNLNLKIGNIKMSDKEKRVERNVTVAGRLATDPKKMDDKGNYRALLVFDDAHWPKDKNEQYVSKILELRDDALKEVFEGKNTDKIPDHTIKFGDDEDFETTYQNHFVMLSQKKAFDFVKRVNGQVIPLTPDEVDEMMYAGVIVSISISLYAMKKKGDIPAHVNAKPRGVISFLKHADRLGSSKASGDDFDGFESEETDDDFGDGGNFD